MGQLPQKERSGKAILALQSQSDAGNSHYLHNLAQISMTYEAKVILDLIPVAYERPGRVAEILTGEDKSKRVMFNMPFVTGQDGQPQMAQGPEAKQYNLSAARYGVSVNIGKSYQSRLQQGADEIGNALPALPPQAQMAILPLYFHFRDFPGAQEMSEVLTKVRGSLMPGLSDEEQETPDQLKAKLMQAQQQMQMMEQQLQQAAEYIKTEQAKHTGTLFAR